MTQSTRGAPGHLIAVFDVDDDPRPSWTVSHEGRGLYFVLEIHVEGDRTNVPATGASASP